MRLPSLPRPLGRATVLTGFAGLAIVAGGAGIAAATTHGSPAPTEVGYGVVVDAPSPTGTDCPWNDDAADTSPAGTR